MKKLQVKTADCSTDRLCRVALQAGFVVYEGKKHCKVKTIDGKFVTTIPRHNHLKRDLVKGIVADMNAHGADIEAL